MILRNQSRVCVAPGQVDGDAERRSVSSFESHLDFSQVGSHFCALRLGNGDAENEINGLDGVPLSPRWVTG